MTTNRLILLAGFGSAALLLGALAFQFLGGLAPCKMCIWQRWPHGIAIVLAAIVLATGQPRLAWAGVLLMLVSTGLGTYHAGVEQGWWPGPDTCTSGPIGDQSAEDLLNQILATPLVRCDEIPWSLFGISMAGYNALISAGLTALWFLGARAKA